MDNIASIELQVWICKPKRNGPDQILSFLLTKESFLHLVLADDITNIWIKKLLHE